MRELALRRIALAPAAVAHAIAPAMPVRARAVVAGLRLSAQSVAIAFDNFAAVKRGKVGLRLDGLELAHFRFSLALHSRATNTACGMGALPLCQRHTVEGSTAISAANAARQPSP